MPKHILILNGSPRPNGNTATLINWLKNALQNGELIVSQHDLYPLNFKGCKHCDACKKISENPACILQDDFTPILENIVAANIIVIASPIYCWSFSGCMSTALDRFYCLFKQNSPCLFAGKKFVGLFTAGGDYFDGMELAQIDSSSLDFTTDNPVCCPNGLTCGHSNSVLDRISPLGGNESSLRSVLDIHDSSERERARKPTTRKTKMRRVYMDK